MFVKAEDGFIVNLNKVKVVMAKTYRIKALFTNGAELVLFESAPDDDWMILRMMELIGVSIERKERYIDIDELYLQAKEDYKNHLKFAEERKKEKLLLDAHWAKTGMTPPS